MENLPKIDLRKEGPANNLKNIHTAVQGMEDNANLKAGILDISEKIIFGLVSKYELTQDDENALSDDLEEALTRSAVNQPAVLREVAVESIRDTMKKREINAPGLRDDFFKELTDRMQVKVAEA